MRSPADMQIIQIEVTNACVYKCSNCTRFCGHHKKNFFMDWPTFQKAVISLDGYQGLAGMMGGEPTLHPDFERFVLFLADNFGEKIVSERGREPITDFLGYINREFGPAKKHQRGLWTSAGPSYYKHFEIIQENFQKQLINDHKYESLHQGILISRKDLGVPDHRWIKIRDECWLQNQWSASITPKGAFFCEIAAALDTLFDGPGGWPIEPGWWKRTPYEFGKQLEWCELCGIPLKGPHSYANEGKDDVSASLFERLTAVGSPKITNGKYRIFNPQSFIAAESSFVHYIPKEGKRVDINRLNLYPRRIDVIAYDARSQQVLMQDSTHPDVSSSSHFGKTVLSTLESLDGQADWIIIHSPYVKMNPVWSERFLKYIFNPGCVYYCNSPEIEDAVSNASQDPANLENGKTAFFMFNTLARCLRGVNWAEVTTVNNFFELWDNEKRISLNKDAVFLEKNSPAPDC